MVPQKLVRVGHDGIPEAEGSQSADPENRKRTYKGRQAVRRRRYKREQLDAFGGLLRIFSRYHLFKLFIINNNIIIISTIALHT